MTALTAHVGYEQAGRGPFGRGAREIYHAIADQPIKAGFITRRTGQPLCGATTDPGECPDGLFPPEVTCVACRAICEREGITVDGGP